MRRGRGLLIAALLAVAIGAAPAGDPLLDAARQGDAATVRALLREGKDPNVAQGDGLTALHIAAQEGDLEVARLLLDARAGVDAKTRIGGYTPLHLASEGGHLEIVRALLDKGADPRLTTTTTGVTPLHLAARAVNGEAVVALLLTKGVAVDARERAAGQTALMFAASYGRIAALRELLRAGADPALGTEVVDVLKRVVIDRAAQNRLRQAFADIRQQSSEGTDHELTTAEEQVAIAQQREFLASDAEMAKLLEGYDPSDLISKRATWNTPSGYRSEIQVDAPPMWETWVGKTGGMTALLHAAREGHIDVAEALLDGGADIDQTSGDGTTPLLMALLNGQFDLAMVFIRRGADPNVANQINGVSPLFAVLQTQWSGRYTDQPQPRAQEVQQIEYMEVLNALLDRGANPNVRLSQHLWYWEFGTGSRLGLELKGATPFWRAAFAQDVDAMRALVAHGADPRIPTSWPEPGMRGGRQQDGRLQEDSGLPLIPEGAPNMYPIHAAAGGGWLGVGAYMVNGVPNNFLNAVKYLVEELGADVNMKDSWGYTPLHYASVRGGNDLIEYLVAKGADVKAESRLGQTVADMARGGNGGYFLRPGFPATVELLKNLGSELKCMNTHFRGTGDFCPGSGAEPFEHMLNEEKPTL